MDIMMKLGPITFSLPATCYQNISQTVEYRHTPQELIGKPPQYQFMGEGEDRLTLTGTLYTLEQGTSADPTTPWRASAKEGKPLPLYDGRGNKLGNFRILSVSTDAGGDTGFYIKGVPKKREFTLDLVRDNG